MKKLKKAVQFCLNPRFLLCFCIAWLITNGWSYILLGIGTVFQIGWMIAVASAYLAFIWFPCTPEKIITIGIAIALLRRLFPNDQNTLGVLKDLLRKAKVKRKHRSRKKSNILQKWCPCRSEITVLWKEIIFMDRMPDWQCVLQKCSFNLIAGKAPFAQAPLYMFADMRICSVPYSPY